MAHTRTHRRTTEPRSGGEMLLGGSFCGPQSVRRKRRRAEGEGQAGEKRGGRVNL